MKKKKKKRRKIALIKIRLKKDLRKRNLCKQYEKSLVGHVPFSNEDCNPSGNNLSVLSINLRI